MARHEFEDADTGDELELRSDLTYEVVKTFVDVDDTEEGGPVFTHRVKLARHQFRVKEGYEGSRDLDGIEHIDLEEEPPDHP